jgi:hypothetical protein
VTGDPRLSASPLVLAGFVVLPLVVTLLFVIAVWRGGKTRRAVFITVGTAAWLALTWIAAASGVLRRFDATPPPFAVLLITIVILGPVIAFSPPGTDLIRSTSLAALVGVQAFRFPLEVVMHRAYEEGVMPGQMSYSGFNFDILTGITAAVLGAALSWWSVPRWVVLLWNVAGLLLLVNVVTIAVASTPLFRTFGDAGLVTFVAYPPFVWLPAVLVLGAWAGHLVVFRKLRGA